MMNLLLISQIVTAGLIALIPVLYPDYSMFSRLAHSGIEQLRHLDNVALHPDNDEPQEQGILEPGDKGFRQLEAVIESHKSRDHRTSRILLIHDIPKNPGISFTSSGAQASEQAYFGIEYEDGEIEVLHTNRFEVEPVLELREPERWIRQKAIERSQLWTTFLVLVWASVSIFGTL